MMKSNGSANHKVSNGHQRRATKYVTGQLIPASGTYRVTHAHPMRREINLLGGNFFPRCAQCGRVVEFELIRETASESAQNRFRLLMQEG